MKQLSLIIILGIITLLIMGVSIWSALHPSITNGIVINKYTTESRTIMTPVHAGKVTTFVPTHVPKEYHIVISGKTNAGKEVEEDFTVAENDYEKYNEGDQFDYKDVNKEYD